MREQTGAGLCLTVGVDDLERAVDIEGFGGNAHDSVPILYCRGEIRGYAGETGYATQAIRGTKIEVIV